MKPSSFYNRLVDVMEELVRFTVLTRDIKDNLVDRYSDAWKAVRSCQSG